MSGDSRSEDAGWEDVRPIAERYNAPPATPREAMWVAIEAELDRSAARNGETSTPGGSLYAVLFGGRKWPLAAAAAFVLLAAGIGIGRLSVGQPAGMAESTGAPAAEEGPAAPPDAAYRALAQRTLASSESFLTLFVADARSGRLDRDLAESATRLLVETRLLMDSPAGRDAPVSQLLGDLELILVQVVQLTRAGVDVGRRERELDLITSGIDQQEVLERLQAVLPGGSVGL